MTTKKKIIISVTAAVLVIAVAIVGVLAAQNTQVGVTNTVSFTATSVNARVEVYVTHGSTPVTISAGSTSGFDNNGVATYTFNEDSTTKVLNMTDVELTAENPTVTYEIYIFNTGSKAFNVTAGGLNNAGTNLTITSTVATGAAANKAAAGLLSSGTLATSSDTTIASALARDNAVKVTITVSITDDTNNAGAEFDWSFVMNAVS